MSLSRTERGRLVRQTIISIALRRQRAGSESNLRRTEHARLKWPDMTSVLHDLPWAIVGAVATRDYMEERATRDLDVLVLAQDAAAARTRMSAAGFSFKGELAIGGSMWESPDGVPVDVIECSDAWCAGALAEASTNEGRDGQRVLPLAYLVLMKLLASRAQDVADVSRMLGAASGKDLDRVRGVVGDYAPELHDDLESLISLGRLERGQ